MKFAVAFLLALTLAACAPMTAPPGAMPSTPGLDPESFLMRDGLRLPLRRWAPEGNPKAIIIALHGMSDYSNAFALPGPEWAKRGILTIAYDQRGFGNAPHPGLWGGEEAMRNDLRDAVAAVRAAHPNLPLFVLGESMGGAVVLTALEQPLTVDGAILVAPAVWSRADMPALYRVALFLAARLVPGLILSNSAATRIVTIIPSDNIEMLRAMGRDPLVQKRTRSDVLFGLTNLMDEARTAPERLPPALPKLLFAYGAKDQVIPARPTQAVIAALGARATVKRYDNGYHMLLRDLGRAAPQNDIADFILGTGTATKPAP
jgi:alpha-beta hydrolase superfamily lysophospholipase